MMNTSGFLINGICPATPINAAIKRKTVINNITITAVFLLFILSPRLYFNILIKLSPQRFLRKANLLYIMQIVQMVLTIWFLYFRVL